MPKKGVLPTCMSISRSEPCDRHRSQVHREREVLARFTQQRIVKRRPRDLQQRAPLADREARHGRVRPYRFGTGLEPMEARSLITSRPKVLALF